MTDTIPYDRDVIFIAVTGGPCGGKTTLMARAKQFLQSHGFYPLVMDEAATELMHAGFSRQPGEWKDPLGFQRHVLRTIVQREKHFYEMAKDLATSRRKVILADRGRLDLIAYAGTEVAAKLLAEQGLTIADCLRFYRMVVHMVSAADGAEQFYTLENNAARTETLEQARTLDKLTQTAWGGHPVFNIVGNEMEFEMKIRNALASFVRVLPFHGILNPTERERMFRFESFRLDFIPKDAVRREIVQFYLSEHIPGHERRLRKEVTHDEVTYYYTIKIGNKITGMRDERQEIITRERYEDLLHEWDRAYDPVVKTRYSFPQNNRYLEVDIFHAPVANLHTVEVENVGHNDIIIFPAEWGVLVEVTRDSRYSNREIASGSLAAAA